MARSYIGVSIILLASMLFPAHGLGGKDRADILLTNDLVALRHIQDFDCNEKIYVVGMFNGLRQGQHAAEVLWINPHGKKQDYALQNFSGGNRQTIWFWLKLHPGIGGGLLSNIDSSAGMEEFIGRWTVKFYIDKKLIDTKPFFVAC